MVGIGGGLIGIIIAGVVLFGLGIYAVIWFMRQ
jgi:hypothetical protein